MEPLVDKIKIFTELSSMSSLMETKVNNFIENKIVTSINPVVKGNHLIIVVHYKEIVG